MNLPSLTRELVRLKREAAIDSWEGTIFSADPYRNATENAKVYIDALRRYNDTIEALRERGEEVSLSKPTLGDFCFRQCGVLHGRGRQGESL